MDDADAAAGVATIIGIGIIIPMLITLALEILFIWLVYRDTKKYSDAAWERSGQNKVLWLVLTFFLGVIGLAIYFLAVAPKVREADIAIKSGQAPGYGQVGLNGTIRAIRPIWAKRTVCPRYPSRAGASKWRFWAGKPGGTVPSFATSGIVAERVSIRQALSAFALPSCSVWACRS